MESRPVPRLVFRAEGLDLDWFKALGSGLVGMVSVFDCEEYEAFVVDIEKDSMVYVLALVTDLQPPNLSLIGYVFDLRMVPRLGKVFCGKFFYGLSYRFLNFVFQVLVVEAELFLKDCLR